MYVLAFVAILQDDDLEHISEDEPTALFREVYWRWDVPRVGDAIWHKTLFPLARFVHVGEVLTIVPDELRPYEKYEIEFYVSIDEFDLMIEKGWHRD